MYKTGEKNWRSYICWKLIESLDLVKNIYVSIIFYKMVGSMLKF